MTTIQTFLNFIHVLLILPGFRKRLSKKKNPEKKPQKKKPKKTPQKRISAKKLVLYRSKWPKPVRERKQHDNPHPHPLLFEHTNEHTELLF
jgi:hypothetical protein